MTGTLEITLNKLNEIIEQQAKRIKELEAEVQKLGNGIESMNNKWVKIRRRLEKRNVELEQLLTEYGRHSAGCSAEFGKECRCRCGWDREKQALKG